MIHIEKDYEHNRGYKITLFNVTDYVHCCNTDNGWIHYLNINKKQYLDILLNEYEAYNNCTFEFPVIYFKDYMMAEKAKEEFYEPRIIMKILVNSQ